MKTEIIAHHIRSINSILASMEHARRTEGQTAKEREAYERQQDARTHLLEELAAREAEKPTVL